MCAALALGGSQAAVAHAQSDEDRAAARTAANEGLRAFEEGRYQDAVDFCSRAEALMHAPTHLLLKARAQVKLGNLVEAQETYFRIKRDQLAADAPRAFVEARASATEEQAALAPRIPTLKITVEGTPARNVVLTIDGQSMRSAVIGLATPMNPGKHSVSAAAPGLESETATVSLAEGAAEAVNLVLHHAATVGPALVAPEGAATAGGEQRESTGRHSALRVGGWIGVGVGAVGAVAGTLFVLKNHSDLNNANGFCGANGCPLSKRDQIDSLDSSASQAATLAWVSYGVGAAGVATGVVLLVLSGAKPSASPQAATVTPWVGPGSGGIRVTF